MLETMRVVGKGGLQWVHGLVTVGDVAERASTGAAMSASMGPRPCDRGRLTLSSSPATGQYRLQWVHGLVTVGDFSHRKSLTTCRPTLQWVHGLVTVGDFIKPELYEARF